jgi:type IV pilus assembly protein PilW
MNQRTRTKALSQRGFSLVELMIAMVLGLAVVAAVGTLSVNATRSYRAMNRTGEQIENGRYALNVIKSDLEHAGFYGLFNPMNANLALPATVPDPCATSATLQSYADSLLLHIPPQCSVTLHDRLNGTQSLVLLRASSDIANTASGDTYIQTNPTEYILGKGTAYITNKGSPSGFVLMKPDGTPTVIRKFHIHVYYIRTYSQTSGDGIPTLMLKSPTDADSNAQSLIEGIENLQIQYGIDSSADGSPDSYIDANDLSLSSTLDWSNIVAVRLNILARSVDADPGYKDTKTHDLGGATPVPAKNDNYHRRVFTSVVRLINVSQRREQ